MPLPHKSSAKAIAFDLKGHKALIITTSYATLDRIDEVTGEVLKKGTATGVYASEFTEPYYTFLDAGMEVDLASISGGEIPIEKLSLMPVVRTEEDSRFLKDETLQQKVKHSLSVSEVAIENYDIVFLSGGWGAAYDFAQSEVLSAKLSEAYASNRILGAVCHGPLGFIGAKKPDGTPLVQDVKMTGVTNRQLKQLFVGNTPKHPETELRKAGAAYACKTGLIDMFNNHTEVDEKHLIVTGQNQKGGRETAQNALKLLSAARSS